MAKSSDFRKRVLEYYVDEGHSIRETAAVFGVAKKSIENWVNLVIETGSLDKRPLNRTFKKLDPEKLRDHLTEHCDDTLREIAEHFKCTISAVDKALKRQKLTLKKKNRDMSSETKRRGSSSANK
jgi:transposase